VGGRGLLMSNDCPRADDTAMIAVGHHLPAVDIFQKDPETHIAFWKDWAARWSTRTPEER
jgi:hypothetical protein